jgi:8-amino-7-oxononanoate synthase
LISLSALKIGMPGAMDSLQAFARHKLDALEALSLRRTPVQTHRRAGLIVERGGRSLISFSCNDYLGLTHHPAVQAAAIEAVRTFGAGAGAARLVTGDHPPLEALEAALASLKATDAACVFASGFQAAVGTIPTVVGPGDLILLDALAHACLHSGAKLSGAQVLTFHHNDADDLAALLAAHRGSAHRALVITEGVFSMDGDIAPLDAISAACIAHEAWLMVDDAHAVGVIGGGRGSGAVFPSARVDLAMGTLSKALGSFGGYVCGGADIIALLKTRARASVFSTALPPASAAAAHAAIGVMHKEPGRVAAVLTKAQLFTAAAGLPQAQSAIVPVILGSAKAALSAQAALEAQGFLAAAIRPPTVPKGTSRLRLTFSAGHDEADILRLADAVKSL